MKISFCIQLFSYLDRIHHSFKHLRFWHFKWTETIKWNTKMFVQNSEIYWNEYTILILKLIKNRTFPFLNNNNFLLANEMIRGCWKKNNRRRERENGKWWKKKWIEWEKMFDIECNWRNEMQQSVSGWHIHHSPSFTSHHRIIRFDVPM